MEETRLIFDERCDEIKKYIEFIKLIDIDKTYIYHTKEQNNGNAILIKNEAKKILKANVYLLLYNLVEATVRNTFKAIYSHIQMKKISFEDICIEFRVEILNNLKKYLTNNDIKTFNGKISDISKDIIYMTFDEKKCFNGNVDIKSIREQFKKIGFKIDTNHSTENGEDLLSIKSQRNSLAHGEISFNECGKDLITSDLDNLFKRTKEYLNSFIQSSEDYITTEGYKK